MLTQTKIGLSGNALKCIACICMLMDHMGYILFPTAMWLRLVGRIAFPIFAYLMAEGCRYTRRPWRHFLEVFLMGVICQVVYQVAEPNRSGIYLNILLTFSVSIALCNVLLAIPSEKLRLGVFFSMAITLWLTVIPLQRRGVDFDYSFWGILLPVVLVLLKAHWQRLVAEGAILCLMAMERNQGQWYALLALLPLALYSGARGSRKFKYVFYLFYPLHLAAIYGIYWALTLLK